MLTSGVLNSKLGIFGLEYNFKTLCLHHRACLRTSVTPNVVSKRTTGYKRNLGNLHYQPGTLISDIITLTEVQLHYGYRFAYLVVCVTIGKVSYILVCWQTCSFWWFIGRGLQNPYRGANSSHLLLHATYLTLKPREQKCYCSLSVPVGIIRTEYNCESIRRTNSHWITFRQISEWGCCWYTVYSNTWGTWRELVHWN